MTEHNLFYYPYASFTNAQLPLLKVVALRLDKLAILDPVGASWDTIGADYVARDAVRLVKEAGIGDRDSGHGVYEAPIAEATPITDDPFHSQALSLKLRRAIEIPLVQQAQAERGRRRKINQLAFAAFRINRLDARSAPRLAMPGTYVEQGNSH